MTCPFYCSGFRGEAGLDDCHRRRNTPGSQQLGHQLGSCLAFNNHLFLERHNIDLPPVETQSGAASVGERVFGTRAVQASLLEQVSGICAW
jgi:hypothetical protein